MQENTLTHFRSLAFRKFYKYLEKQIAVAVKAAGELPITIFLKPNNLAASIGCSKRTAQALVRTFEAVGVLIRGSKRGQFIVGWRQAKAAPFVPFDRAQSWLQELSTIICSTAFSQVRDILMQARILVYLANSAIRSEFRAREKYVERLEQLFVLHVSRLGPLLPVLKQTERESLADLTDFINEQVGKLWELEHVDSESFSPETVRLGMKNKYAQILAITSSYRGNVRFAGFYNYYKNIDFFFSKEERNNSYIINSGKRDTSEVKAKDSNNLVGSARRGKADTSTINIFLFKKLRKSLPASMRSLAPQEEIACHTNPVPGDKVQAYLNYWCSSFESLFHSQTYLDLHNCRPYVRKAFQSVAQLFQAHPNIFPPTAFKTILRRYFLMHKKHVPSFKWLGSADFLLQVDRTLGLLSYRQRFIERQPTDDDLDAGSELVSNADWLADLTTKVEKGVGFEDSALREFHEACVLNAYAGYEAIAEKFERSANIHLAFMEFIEPSLRHIAQYPFPDFTHLYGRAAKIRGLKAANVDSRWYVDYFREMSPEQQATEIAWVAQQSEIDFRFDLQADAGNRENEELQEELRALAQEIAEAEKRSKRPASACISPNHITAEQ
jgi:hypothetical protein